MGRSDGSLLCSVAGGQVEPFRPLPSSLVRTATPFKLPAFRIIEQFEE
jgi:hypothetical protein